MKAFEQQYYQHFDYIYRYLNLRLQDPKAAEDVTSQAFLNAFRCQKQYNPKKGSWKQWMTGVAKNALLNHWRKEKITLSLEEIHESEMIFNHPSQILEQMDRQLIFDALLDSLPKNLRTLALLRYVDDLTYEQMAELTGKTPQAIRQLFSRLHKRLKDQFQETHDSSTS